METYTRGEESLFPTQIDSFNKYQDTTKDIIPAAAMNKMAGSIYSLEQELISAPLPAYSEDMKICAATVVVSNLVLDTYYTLDFATSGLSALYAFMGGSDTKNEACVMVDMRPTCATTTGSGYTEAASSIYTSYNHYSFNWAWISATVIQYRVTAGILLDPINHVLEEVIISIIAIL